MGLASLALLAPVSAGANFTDEMSNQYLDKAQLGGAVHAEYA